MAWYHGIREALIRARSSVPRFKFGSALAGEKFPRLRPSISYAYLPLLRSRPKVSVVMPVYNSRWLKQAVESVLNQSYDNFELILVDDCSTDHETVATLQSFQGREKIRLLKTARNLGISGATNIGIEVASGEFIGFLDHDDLLHPDALAYFVRTLNDGVVGDVFYTDEAVINEHGMVVGKFEKCQITLDLLLSVNAVLHFCLVRRSKFAEIGLLDSKYDGAQDHDLMLRAMEQGCTFIHMPYLLYAWRTHRNSVSTDVRLHNPERNLESSKEFPKAYQNGKKAIQAYLDRNNIQATVTDDGYFWYRVKYALPRQDEVAIIIPFKDKAPFLRTLLQSLERTSYRNFALYLINNRSVLPETTAYLNELQRGGNTNLHIVEFDEPFNFSRLYNSAISRVPNELVLLLNNDVEIIKGDWLEALLEHIYRDGVAAVGCHLIRKDGSTQHAGMVFQPSVYYCAMNLNYSDSYFTQTQRDVSGVTAACMLIKRSIFLKVGGFDELHFPIGFSDADLCLKLIQAGYRIIYTPFAELYHHESVTRSIQEESYEKYTLFRRYIGETPMVDQRYRLR